MSILDYLVFKIHFLFNHFLNLKYLSNKKQNLVDKIVQIIKTSLIF